jgi:outer membrane biosynthesis protein TonB
VVELLQRRLCPDRKITGILPCLYDSRLRLAREVLGEIRRYFPEQVFATSIRTNIKLAEAPSHGCTIFEYAPSSPGAKDYLSAAKELRGQEPTSHALPELAPLEQRIDSLTRAPAPAPELQSVEIPRPEPEPEQALVPESAPVPVPVSDPAPVSVPDPPQSPPSPLNYGTAQGEDRPHLAAKTGPACSPRWPTA